MSRSRDISRIPNSVLSLCVLVGRDRSTWMLILLGSGFSHATCHGAVAFVAALLGRAITGSSSASIVPIDASPVHLALLGLMAVLAKGVFGVFATFAQSRLASDAGHHLRDRTIEALLDAGPATPIPTAIARILSRIREAERAVQLGPFAVFRAIAQLIPIAAGLFIVSPTLTALAILVLAPFAAVLALVRRSWRRAHEATMTASDALHEELDDVIRHLDLWRTYGTGEHVRDVLRKLGQRAARTKTRSESLGVAISSANEVLGAAALIAALLVASFGIGLSDGGSVVAFIALFFMAYRPLRDLGDARSAWIRGNEALGAIARVHLVPPASHKPAPPAFSSAARVEVRELGVPGKSPMVSFTLAAGRMIALAGATGAGKSTLLRALLGLEPNAAGLVSLNGQVLLPGQVGPSFRPFAWVPQDAPVVSGSLADNFRLAGADPEGARRELEALGAGSMARDVAETKIGLAGRALSGGERRWVALARALATGLPVVILDEPTVGLDRLARDTVLAVLERARGSRAILVASHDEAVLRLADEVVQVE